MAKPNFTLFKKFQPKTKKFLASHWLALTLSITFLLRLPSLFEPFTYGDEGIYLTLGQAVRKGLTLYRDIHDNKPPLLYLLAALSGNFVHFRLLLFFWSLLTIIIFHELCLRLFSKNKKAVIIATATFALLTSLRTFEGNIANAENFMLLPTITAFYLAFQKKFSKITSFSWLLIGSLLSLTTLFKVPGVFDFATLALLLFFFSQKFNQALITKLFFLTSGFLLPILTTIVYYAYQKALPQYLTATFFQNIPYLASWAAAQPQTLGLPLALIARTGIVLTITILVFALRSKLPKQAQLIIIWFFFTLFAALLSSRPYPHYLLQTAPALSLSLGLIFFKKKLYFIPLTIITILAINFSVFKFWHYSNFSYYHRFAQFLLGKPSQNYFALANRHSLPVYQIAKYIQAHTKPEERVFIWGNQPSIYALSNRLPVGRYTAAYHIQTFNGFKKTMQALTQKPPHYIIAEQGLSFPRLETFLQNNYALQFQLNKFQIFHLVIHQTNEKI